MTSQFPSLASYILTDICTECKATIKDDYNRDGLLVCTNCGVCIPGSARCEAQYVYPDSSECRPRRRRLADIKPSMRFIERRGLNVTGAARPKYNPLYYFNERIGQFMLTCPPPPEDALEAIECEYYYNADEYPTDPDQLTRASAVKLCKAARFVTAKGNEASCGRYAERWKYILAYLGKYYWLPPPEFVLYTQTMNPIMEKEIRRQLKKMKWPRKRATTTKGPSGPSVDYRIRLMLWLWNGQEETMWDSEFPYLKTQDKRRDCDRIFANVCRALGLPFAPSNERNDPPLLSNTAVTEPP